MLSRSRQCVKRCSTLVWCGLKSPPPPPTRIILHVCFLVDWYVLTFCLSMDSLSLVCVCVVWLQQMRTLTTRAFMIRMRMVSGMTLGLFGESRSVGHTGWQELTDSKSNEHSSSCPRAPAWNQTPLPASSFFLPSAPSGCTDTFISAQSLGTYCDQTK